MELSDEEDADDGGGVGDAANVVKERGTTRRFPELTAQLRTDKAWRAYALCEEGEKDVSMNSLTRK
jgi:hypothetical protein